MDLLNDDKIVDSWNKNAVSWTKAVREGQIESRRQATDQAILDAILDTSPNTVLDIGCGEGWLARRLSEEGVNTLGVDVVPELIEYARSEGGGRFEILSYEDLANHKLSEKFNTIICNFSLIGENSVSGLFRAIPRMLNPDGWFLVQTMHPVVSADKTRYQDGWREGSWAGFSTDFIDPAPWYFRTLQNWIKLFTDCGFSIIEMREPIHPATGKLASVIFMGRLPS